MPKMRCAFGVWRLAFGVRRSAFGVWRSAFGALALPAFPAFSARRREEIPYNAVSAANEIRANLGRHGL
jgi:hypothetical protein